MRQLLPSGPDRSLLEDERGIEGLPIRLVIAIVVGLAALGIMMQILGGLPTDQFSQEEVDVEFDQANVQETGSVTITVIGQNDQQPVRDATVTLDSGTAELERPYEADTNSDGEVTFSFDRNTGTSDVYIDWASNQDRGSVEVTVDPPADSQYVDDQANKELTVYR